MSQDDVVVEAATPKKLNNNDVKRSWWGRKDSNLRSHKTADLQSAPFATRDTSSSVSVRNRPPGWRRTGSWMALRPRADRTG